jgi:translation elongation factor EF-G
MDYTDTEELRENLVRKLAKKHLDAMRENCLTGHEQTLSAVASELVRQMNQGNRMKGLIRSALACGPQTAGEMLQVMIDSAMRVPAELAGIKQVEHLERDRSGLDVERMRRASTPATHFAVAAALAAVAASQATRSPAPG